MGDGVHHSGGGTGSIHGATSVEGDTQFCCNCRLDVSPLLLIHQDRSLLRERFLFLSTSTDCHGILCVNLSVLVSPHTRLILP